MCIIYAANTAPFRDQRIPLFIKSLNINRPSAPIVKIIIDHTLLLRIVTVLVQLQFPLEYKALHLLAFFSFLRIFNILPHAAKNFDKLGICVWGFRFICCFTSRSTARVILRWVVYRWRKPVHTAL